MSANDDELQGDEIELVHLEERAAADFSRWWDRARAAWKAGPVKILVMLAVATAANYGATIYVVAQQSHEPAANCQTLQRAIGGTRKLVETVLRPVPADSTSRVVVDLRATLAPGGDLAIPDC